MPVRARLGLAHRGVAAAVAAVEARWPEARPVSVEACERHTNARVEIRYDDGRTLVVKSAADEWRRQRFAASRAACGLLLRRTGVIVPEPIPIPRAVTLPPLEAYWKIHLTPLADAWSTLDGTVRPRALRSWGELLRRIHRVRPRGHGPFPRAEREPGSLEAHLTADLGERLLPAVRCTWPQAVPSVDALVAAAPRIASRAGEPVLLHGDPHQANVLCEVSGRRVRCVGVLDLEAAWAGPPEADVAVAELIHGPLFTPLPSGWSAEFRRGYGEPLDPAALTFFRAVHLANLGYYAALTGLHAHAAEVLRALRADVRALRRQVLLRREACVPLGSLRGKAPSRVCSPVPA
jgi:aminoglycoside phosphotransferase (APT) family kinase protein